MRQIAFLWGGGVSAAPALMNGERVYKFQRSGVGLALFLRVLEERRDAFQKLASGVDESPPDGRGSGVSGKGRSVSLGVEGGDGAERKDGVVTGTSPSIGEGLADDGVSKERRETGACACPKNGVVEWKGRKSEDARRKEAHRNRAEKRLRERRETLKARERERIAQRHELEAKLNEARKGSMEANERIAELKKRREEVALLKHNLVQELKQVGRDKAQDLLRIMCCL